MQQIIAVYWTLKMWNGNNGLLSWSKFIWIDYVKCYGITWTWFPVASFKWEREWIELEVELYEVSEEVLKNIDRLEWYNPPNHIRYDRIPVTTTMWKMDVQIYHQDIKTIDKSILEEHSLYSR